MRTTIDARGRVAIPKPLRDELGLTPGTQLEIRAVDGRLEALVPSRVRVEQGPHGVRFTADASTPLSTDQVRALIQRGRP
jgi:AbrB family looped-hinge helix DNA binding protein